LGSFPPGGAHGVLPEFPSPPTAEVIGVPAAEPPSSAAELLAQLSAVAVAARSLEAAAASALSLLLRFTGADAGLLVVPGPRHAAEVIGWTGAPAQAVWSRDLARGAEEGGLPAVVPDLRTDSRLADAHALLAAGYRACLCQPLLVAGGAVGSLHLLAATPERFAQQALEGTALGARVLALAVEFHRARRDAQLQAEERSRELALLLETSRKLGRLTRRREIPDVAFSALPRIGDLDLGQILLVDRGALDLRALEHVPLSDELRAAARGASLRTYAELGGDPVGLPAPVPGPARAGEATALRSELHRPLERHGQVVGLISAYALRRDAFGEAERRLLMTLAHQISATLDRLETARERERLRLAAAVDGMEQGLAWIDAPGRLRVVNPAGRRFLEDLAGPEIESVPIRLREIDLDALRGDLLAGRRRTFQAEVRSATSGRVYSVTGSPIPDRNDQPEGIILLLADVTEQIAFREKLAQTEKLSALGEMISGVAHELNNPLAAVMGYAQLLESSPELPPPARRKVQSISQQAVRCQRIVRGLLSFARHHPSEKAPVDLNGVVREVLQLLEYPLRSDGVELDLALDPDIPAVLGDSHQLQQVVLNLLTNAQHAIQASPRRGRLSARTHARDARVVLVVEDNGGGIAPEHLRRVFDPFFTTKTVGKGTGLGLSLAYGCITEHGGEIRVESAFGEWTRFTIELPASTVRLRVPELPHATVLPVGPPSRILVVDDEPDVAAVIAEALSAQGHVVEIAADGLQARGAIADRRFDLVISDLRMPEMDGRALDAFLRRLDPAAAPRLVFSTGDTVTPETVAFLRSSGRRYVTKPFSLGNLLRVVEETLRGEG
jgi:two-component system NtrC family sensor kinase